MLTTAFLYMVPLFAAGELQATQPKTDPITPQMREALARVNKVHAGMDRKAIDDAVGALHEEIARQEPEVFVPLAVPHLMRLAPQDTQTRAVLRRALAKGWIAEELARTYLVQAGDAPGPHIKHLIEAMEDKDPKVRVRAIEALGGCGTAAAPALPRLRQLVKDAKADPADFSRAYTSVDEAPVHVRAHWAILVIEAASKKK
jgi:hypothetical protein